MILAQQAGLTPALITVAVALGLGPLAGLRYPFRSIPPADLLPAGDWPAPAPPVADTGPAGPVMVTFEYRPRAGERDELLAALRDAERFARIAAMTDQPPVVTHWLTPA